MNISIKSYQASISMKAPVQESAGLDNVAKSEAKSSSSSDVGSVSISCSAQALYAQSSAAERQASMSQSDLSGLYDKSNRPCPPG